MAASRQPFSLSTQQICIRLILELESQNLKYRKCFEAELKDEFKSLFPASETSQSLQCTVHRYSYNGFTVTVLIDSTAFIKLFVLSTVL